MFAKGFGRHLDLGCGDSPRNPYGHRELYGIDIREIGGRSDVIFKQANLSLQAIPFEDSYFDSVSAFDYVEHVPRVLIDPARQETVLPFVRLMSEVWRVLIPGGRFYALTPAYPNAVAFQDPTHVNTITAETHQYFCGESPMARMYGFEGRFKVIKAEFAVPKDARIACDLNWRKKVRRLKYRLQGRLTHFLWELEAQK